MQFYRLKINKKIAIYDVITPERIICQSKTHQIWKPYHVLLKAILVFVCFQFFVILSISETTRNLRKAHKKEKLKERKNVEQSQSQATMIFGEKKLVNGDIPYPGSYYVVNLKPILAHTEFHVISYKLLRS